MKTIHQNRFAIAFTFTPWEWAGHVRTYEEGFPVGSIVVIKHFKRSACSVFRVVSNSINVAAFRWPRFFDRRDLQAHTRFVKLERWVLDPCKKIC